jgi:ATP-dependent DNA helicase RecG
MTSQAKTPDADPLLPEDSLVRLKGIGPRSAEALADDGKRSVIDLLLHLPRRYEDRSNLVSLDRRLCEGEWILVRGKVLALRVRRIPRRRTQIVDGLIDDGCGELPVVWFNQKWLDRRLKDEAELYLFGRLREAKGGTLQLVNPEIEQVGEEVERIVPIYPRLGRFGGRRLRALIAACLPAAAALEDPLPAEVIEEFELPGLALSLREIHAPTQPVRDRECAELLEKLNGHSTPYHRRLAFDELLAFAATVAEKRNRRQQQESGVITPTDAKSAERKAVLPYELTSAQKRVLDEVSADLARAAPMARLVQGDVGAGKTAVAAVAMLMALEGGFQVAMMAPTELLAEQHARTLESIFGATRVAPQLLTASLQTADKRRLQAGLADGTIPLVVGTHALFQETVDFHDLGLVVVDEQHRFGVAQRHALLAKGRSPHLLVMTATPIPRSLALTVYGDLDLSLIDELPPGRRPVRTVIRPPTARTRIFEFLRKEIAAGGRGFIVYPTIEGGENGATASLEQHQDEVRSLLPEVAIGVLHGRLPRDEREAVTQQFRTGAVQLLLATTVVEVGVDVPEASVMVIESAERFGLSQLHQLRGRVGRGQRSSWCILIASQSLSEVARDRLGVVCRSSDGFEIADADLAIRGPGELTGTRQWGPAGFRFANLIRDRELIGDTRRIAAGWADTGTLEPIRSRLGRFHPVDEILHAG